MQIDLNADVGEGEDDLPIFAFVTSVNVACGAHAGDDETMARSVAEAARRELAIGAHPGYEDREHLGRRALSPSADELAASLVDQIERLQAHCMRAGAALTHVKPHGALYNQAAGDPEIAATVAAAVRSVDPSLALVGLAASAILRAGEEAGLAVAAEAFCDRAYLANGTLVPRGTPGAVVADPALAAERAVAIATGEPVTSVAGGRIRIKAETICMHADTPGALEIARAVRSALEKAGVRLEPLARPGGG